jgi:hypothetical protein
MLRWLSPEISRCLRDKDQAVVGSAVAVCGSLYKVGSRLGSRASRLHGLTFFLEWIIGPRCPRKCVSGTPPLWKVLRQFHNGGVDSAESAAVVLRCSVSSCGLGSARLATLWDRPSTEVLKVVVGLIKRSASSSKTHGKSRLSYLLIQPHASWTSSQPYSTTASLSSEMPLRTH